MHPEPDLAVTTYLAYFAKWLLELFRISDIAPLVKVFCCELPVKLSGVIEEDQIKVLSTEAPKLIAAEVPLHMPARVSGRFTIGSGRTVILTVSGLLVQQVEDAATILYNALSS